MSTVSHHDSSRAGVGKTAFGVAYFRAMESEKPDHLIYDEFSLQIWEGDAKYHEDFKKIFPGEKMSRMVDGLAVRTKKIDEEILAAISAEKGIDQVVVIGAGLDFRPWRLHHYFPTEEQRHHLRSKHWFEVDFQEMFDYKLKQIEKSAATSYFNYHSIVGNACVDNWEQALLAQGFDPSKKSLWLLEGFASYLTEEELKKVFYSINQISQPGSKMIITFLGFNYSASTDMHRFRTNQPAEFISHLHWRGEQEEEFTQLMPKYGRDPTGWNDYFLVVANYEG